MYKRQVYEIVREDGSEISINYKRFRHSSTIDYKQLRHSSSIDYNFYWFISCIRRNVLALLLIAGKHEYEFAVRFLTAQCLDVPSSRCSKK